MVQLFSVPAFFILFRETLEASIILSVMLTVLNKIVDDQAILKRLRRHVWVGVVAGVLLSLLVAAIFLSLYYTVAKNAWDSSEALWEGILGLVAVVLITLMAFSMFRVTTWRKKWERKLTKVTMDAVDDNRRQAGEEQLQSKRSKYALALIPFTVVVREGVESVIFLGGIGLEGSGTAYPIPAVLGAACGILVGYLLYAGGNHLAFKYFLNAATLLLLVIAAGLFSTSVHEFEEYTKNESFVWQLHCCDPYAGGGGWKLLNAVVGWNHEATKGTLSAYILYWVFVVVVFVIMRIRWARKDEQQSVVRSLQEPELNDVPL